MVSLLAWIAVLQHVVLPIQAHLSYNRHLLSTNINTTLIASTSQESDTHLQIPDFTIIEYIVITISLIFCLGTCSVFAVICYCQRLKTQALRQFRAAQQIRKTQQQMQSKSTQNSSAKYTTNSNATSNASSNIFSIDITNSPSNTNDTHTQATLSDIPVHSPLFPPITVPPPQPISNEPVRVQYNNRSKRAHTYNPHIKHYSSDSVPKSPQSIHEIIAGLGIGTADGNAHNANVSVHVYHVNVHHMGKRSTAHSVPNRKTLQLPPNVTSNRATSLSCVTSSNEMSESEESSINSAKINMYINEDFTRQNRDRQLSGYNEKISNAVLEHSPVIQRQKPYID